MSKVAKLAQESTITIYNFYKELNDWQFYLFITFGCEVVYEVDTFQCILKSLVVSNQFFTSKNV